jgi:hypothetical protein
MYSRGNPSLCMRVSAGSRYRGRILLMRPFSPPWKRVMVHLGFRVSPASAFNSPTLVSLLLLSLVETVVTVLSQSNTLRMRSCRACLILNGLLLITVRLGLPALAQREKDRRLLSLLACLASADAIEAGLDPIDMDMPAERLSPSAYEKTKKTRVERGQ